VKKLAVLGLLAAVGAVPGGARPQATSACPRRALPLTGTNPIGPAANAALPRVAAAEKPQIRGATFADFDTGRGPQVRTQCGRRVLERTIIVYIQRRAYLPAQSASQGVYFVSRFAGGYRVWQVAH
jgi:hypothetical protein